MLYPRMLSFVKLIMQILGLRIAATKNSPLLSDQNLDRKTNLGQLSTVYWWIVMFLLYTKTKA